MAGAIRIAPVFGGAINVPDGLSRETSTVALLTADVAVGAGVAVDVDRRWRGGIDRRVESVAAADRHGHTGHGVQQYVAVVPQPAHRFVLFVWLRGAPPPCDT